MAALEIGIALRRTFVLTLFATLPRNHMDYRDSIVPVGSLARLL